MTHCPHCKTDKPDDAFYPRSQRINAIRYCIACTNERSKREKATKPKQPDKWADWIMSGMSERDY
jgi:hypothetical protein